jgi:hypothetical protein
VVVAPAGGGPQRRASPNPASPEALAHGERVRIGYTPGDHRYLTSISIDDRGEVTPLYPEAGRSLPISGREQQYLPESIEFTGTGTERLVVVLSDEPLDVEEVKRAAQKAFDEAHGEVSRVDRLDLPGEQFHRTFLKP